MTGCGGEAGRRGGQKALAAALGVDRSTVTGWLSGRHAVTLPMLVAAARALGLQVVLERR